MINLKKCNTCGLVKNTAEFYPNKASKDKLAYCCKGCWNKKCKSYRSKNPQKVKETNRSCYLKQKSNRIAQAKEWHRKNPEKAIKIKYDFKQRNPDYSRISTLKKFGITIEQFEIRLLEINNSCEICGEIFKKRNEVHIDHSHSSLKVRGLLCSKCNTSLGLMKENTANIFKMIKYLRKYGKAF